MAYTASHVTVYRHFVVEIHAIHDYGLVYTGASTHVATSTRANAPIHIGTNVKRAGTAFVASK